MHDLSKLKHQEGLAGFSYDRKTLYEKLARLPIEELILLRDELERIRVQAQRSKFKLKAAAADNAVAEEAWTMKPKINERSDMKEQGKESFERVAEHLYKRQYQTAGGEWRSKFYGIFTDRQAAQVRAWNRDQSGERCTCALSGTQC
jgi:hypothetical protein